MRAGHRAVTGRDHHAEVGVEGGGVEVTPGVGTTPSSSTSTPAAARPATTAASRNCPEIRVSRPTRSRPVPVRVTEGTGFGEDVRGGDREVEGGSRRSPPLATPRTPSVPKMRPMSPGSARDQRLLY